MVITGTDSIQSPGSWPWDIAEDLCRILKLGQNWVTPTDHWAAPDSIARPHALSAFLEPLRLAAVLRMNCLCIW